MRKAIIFDLDGTLIELPINYDRLRKKLQKLLRTNHPFSPLLESVNYLTEANPKLRSSAYEIITEEEKLAVRKLKPQHNLKNVLSILNNQGFHLGLVTMQSKASVLYALKKMNANKFFHVIVTRDYALNRREQIKKALRALHAKTGIMVGDRTQDIEAGKSLGCLTIGVSKRLKRRKLLKKAKPSNVISEIQEIVNVLGIGSKK